MSGCEQDSEVLFSAFIQNANNKIKCFVVSLETEIR